MVIPAAGTSTVELQESQPGSTEPWAGVMVAVLFRLTVVPAGTVPVTV
jgi:hypothetical protein